MSESRIYRGLTITTFGNGSDKVCYIILPEGLKKDGDSFLESKAEEYSCRIVVLSGLNWNDDLTPWPASGVFKEKKPFGGKAKGFLKSFVTEYITDIEQSLGVNKPERTLIGVSLSGLFSVWAATQTDKFSYIASISGSLWYDNFAQWLQTQEMISVRKVFLCLGDKEYKSRDERMAMVQACTESVVLTLQNKGVDVDFRMVSGTHFSDIRPRLNMAFQSILG